ncbi:disease resistance protein RML1B-like [Ziziphus jujuba]|uniref:Disease resistance protein RML1B-like n=1 Tax=Ziziphus jujuba TaxID=326968 RepID=A0ABM4AAR9_ZIZJJ|nr:disease resistance protein RML1B-like [Ziziphus jujuba]
MAASSSSSQEKYEVFVSFRGEDTRDGFTGHLYNALCKMHINTYKDDVNLKSGHRISEIENAIKESKICIIVFSKDFASSTWCLDEVVRILECKRGGNDIIPIFYGIEPSIVRKQEQSYAVSFSKHEQRFQDNMDKVQHWRDALNEVAAISGYDSKNARPEYKFIDEIVEDILSKLSRYTSTCDHSKWGLIGIENRIKEIERLLCIDSMDLSRRFESRCFLRNVREEYEKRGVKKLSKELLSQLFYHDKTIPSLESTHLQERLCRTKVLIVLDDLDDSISQLNELLPKGYKFGAGSRIIVTTRDAQLLKSRTDEVYEVKRLNNVEALKLFLLHAFENNRDLEGYEVLSKSVADYADEWKSALDKLQTVPVRKIEKVLRISFDQLGKRDKKGYTDIQDVFLDLACWLVDGVGREFVESITHHPGGTKIISDLIDKCLIIEDYNRLSMHSLIRQMGQAIVCDENKEPGNRSRLWKAKDICHVLERNTGSCTMEGMLLHLRELGKDVRVRPTAFSNMYCLRFLRFFDSLCDFGFARSNKMYLPSEGIEYLSDELRYFQWDLYPSKYLPSNFSTENLVQLVMRQSQLVELPWNEHQPIGNLTEIDLSYCESLIQIPNLCAATNLQRINFRGCKSLVQVPSSFKNLDKLECLDLGLCDNLKDGLENLPLNIRVLFLARTAIEALPSSFSCLMKLEYLNLSECENMTNGIENLPSNLQTLTLSGCIKLEDIQNIPSSIGITELELDFIGIETLPESIWKMRCLKQLRLHDCPYLEMLQEISDDCMSSSLEKLDIYSCPSLKSISASIWKKSNLKHLTIEYCPDLEKLQEVSDDYMSSSLEVLEIRDCAILKSIPESIWKIRCLKDLTLKDCPNLENLQEISDDCMSSGLEELYISGCTRLKLNPMQNLCVAIKLQKIDLVGCTSLVQVPPWFKNLQKLSHLGLVCCENLKDGLENLPLNILWLSLYGTAIEALPSSFRDLETLLYLTLTDCKNLTDGIENLPMNLRTLYLSGCEKLKSIPVLPSRLNYLDASNCASLDASICLSLGTMSSWWDLQQVDDDFERLT